MAGLPNAELFVEWKTGVPMALADTNRSTFMPSGASAAPGLVPAPPLTPGAVLFLREDGTWSLPPMVGTGSVTNSMLASMPDSTIKGRASGAGAGEPQDLTASEATAILNIFVSASVGKKGLVPAPTTTENSYVLGAEGWTPGVTRLATVTVNGATSVISFNLSSYTDYKALQFRIWGLRPTSDGETIWLRFSATGVTYDATLYNYIYQYFSPTTAALSLRSSGSATQVEMAFIVGNATAEGFNGQIDINGFNESTIWPRLNFTGYWIDSSGTPNNVTNVGGGARENAQALLGLQILCSNSTIAAGQIYVYGYR